LPKKFPALTPDEVVAILISNGFARTAFRGSHAHYEKGPRKVTVDMAVKDFNTYLIKSMIAQSGLTREDFYGATKSTAKKIGKR
jgi:predicted RNA binding protein YcfA (HicA-like mRNA interferase family)